MIDIPRHPGMPVPPIRSGGEAEAQGGRKCGRIEVDVSKPEQMEETKWERMQVLGAERSGRTGKEYEWLVN